MDKKSIIGIALIFVILMVFSYLNKPSKQEIADAQHRRDSIQQVEAQRALEQQKVIEEQKAREALISGDSTQREALEK